MRSAPLVLIVATLIIALALAASFELGFITVGSNQSQSTTCTSCGFQEPIVDVIMPVIGSSGNTSNPDRLVNMTTGMAQTFEVDVYPTVPLNFSMEFSSILVSSATGSSSMQASATPSATFDPQSLHVGANEKGITLMTVRVPASAARGVYDSVVTAVNVENSTEVWGLYFQLAVS